MNHLPQEILHNIFIRLPLIQKQECMLVCNLWKEIIYTRCFFHTIICQRGVPFPLLSRFGEQVEELRLKINLHSSFEIMPLLYLIPNVHAIEIKTYESDCTITDMKPESVPMRIESIKERGACEMTRALGTAGLCPRLVTLNLEIIISNRTLKLKAVDDICESLKDMPLLEHLTIKNHFLSLSHCETIHRNAPKLSLLDVQLTCTQLISDIKPAPMVIRLSLKMKHFSREAQKMLFVYVSKKYPRLQHFQLYDPAMLFGATDNLKEEVFKLTLPVLIKSLSAPLTSLELEGIELNPSFFQLLDSLNYRLLKCRLAPFNERTAHALAQSKQSQCIEQLCVSIVYNVSFQWLTPFKNLKSLQIDYDQDDTCIYGPSLFVSCPPTLESLSIGEDFPLLLAQNCKTQLPFVKRLQIDSVGIVHEAYRFLTRSFPNLTWLSLTIDGERRITKLDFSIHHFHYCKLVIVRSKPYSVVLTTLVNNRTCYYSPTYKNRVMGLLTLDDYIPSIPKEKLSKPVAVKLTCGSVKNLVLDDWHASLF